MGKREKRGGAEILDSPGQLDSRVKCSMCLGLKGVDFQGRTQLMQQAQPLSVFIKIQPADEQPIHGTKSV